ncbi:hypothetical protein [Escherichia sp. E1130]|uniref:hypothetical protein n=1 Tax=Escherichia sp. E1130 TaxID=2041645 RepID=UPI00108057B0|nr:hypothetical protein [Escherichia sp. E1130]TGC24425.1 hypothetical protein CQJ27_14255 [Escherichia sp. E1130]TLI62168.1 hypothetical protein FEK66_25370 [Escherichia sp. E1130]
MEQKQIASDIISLSELAAKFAGGKIPTELAFHTLIDWAFVWQTLFGWDSNQNKIIPGAGFKNDNGKLALHTGPGIEDGVSGLRIKLKPDGGLQLSEGQLSLDGSVAVNPAAFARLPFRDLDLIAGLLNRIA